jgi:hypothetical protein
MPLDLDDIDLDLDEAPAKKVASPRKTQGKPESPQSMVARGSKPWPKGQRVVITEGEYEDHTGAITASRKSRGDYFNLKLELDEGGEISVRSTSVRLAGASDATKELSLAKGKKKAASPEATDEADEAQSDTAERNDELKQAASDYPVGTRVVLRAAKKQVIGRVASQPMVHGQNELVKVEVEWPEGARLAIVKSLSKPTFDELEEDGGLDDDNEYTQEELEVINAQVRGETVNLALGLEEDDDAPEGDGDEGGDEDEALPGSDAVSAACEAAEAMMEEPDTPAPEFSDDLQQYVGLTDSLEIAKLIGLPIEFKVENMGHVVTNLRTIIGLPVNQDVRLMAEKIQRDHFWVHSTCTALQWAAKEAATTLESWTASQISQNWNLARQQYEKDIRRWKAKEIERPLAPDRSVIKSEVRASATWLAYQRALHRIEYWRDLIDKVAAAGHDRKAMLLMNINKSAPRSDLDDSMTPDKDIELAESEIDELFGDPEAPVQSDSNGSGTPKVVSPEDDRARAALREEELPATAPAAPSDPYEGKGELFPWLRVNRPTVDSCGECDAIVYVDARVEYDADQTPHEKTCQGGEQSVETEDDGFADLDLDDLDLGGEDDDSEPESATGDDAGVDTESDDDDSDDVNDVSTVSHEDEDFLDGIELEI